MTPRDAGGVQEDLRVGVAAENVLALVERDAAVHPFHEEGDCRGDSRRSPSARAGPSRETRSQTGGRSG